MVSELELRYEMMETLQQEMDELLIVFLLRQTGLEVLEHQPQEMFVNIEELD